MFEMKLANGNTDCVASDAFEFDNQDRLEPLRKLFEGEMMLCLVCSEIMELDEDNIAEEPDNYSRIESVKWDLSDTGKEFDLYIEEWLNSLDGISEIGDLFYGGIQSGITQLIWTKECRRVFVKYLEDIEEMISEFAENMGEETFYGSLFKEGLNIDKLTQCCFEERMRQIIEVDLGLAM